MPKPLALRAERLLRAGLHPGCVLDERAQLRPAGLFGGRPLGELVMPSPCGGQLAPGAARLGAAAQLLLSDEGVEYVELVRRPCETPLLELAGHRDQPFGERGHILARCAPPP